MNSLRKFTLCLGLALNVLASSGFHANAASACQNVSQASERSKLQQLLSSNSITQDERAFLLAGSQKRLREMQSSALNTRGAHCGIDAVRGQVLGCMNNTLPSAIRRTSQKKKSSQALWGRTGLSARGAVVIGMFHACRGSAEEAFMAKGVMRQRFCVSNRRRP